MSLLKITNQKESFASVLFSRFDFSIVEEVQASLVASQQTDQRLPPDQCLLDSGCAYKQPEKIVSTVLRIFLSFSHKKADIFLFFLILYEGENTFCGKRDSGLSTLSQYFQVYYTISKLVVRREQYRDYAIDSLCFKSLVKNKVDLQSL